MLRGPGDFFSQNSDDNIRQSGGFNFKFASACEDGALLERAFSIAKGIVDADPELALPEHSLLKENLDCMMRSASTIS